MRPARAVGCLATSQTIANAATPSAGLHRRPTLSTADHEVDASSINGDEIALPSRSGRGGQLAPTRLTGPHLPFSIHWRLPGRPVTVNCLPHMGDTRANVASVGSFNVVEPKATVVAPFPQRRFPSTVTGSTNALALPDGIDNDSDGTVDEADELSEYRYIRRDLRACAGQHARLRIHFDTDPEFALSAFTGGLSAVRSRSRTGRCLSRSTSTHDRRVITVSPRSPSATTRMTRNIVVDFSTGTALNALSEYREGPRVRRACAGRDHAVPLPVREQDDKNAPGLVTITFALGLGLTRATARRA